VVQPDRGRPRRFCSPECKHKAGTRKQNRSLAPLRQANPDPRTCPTCGTTFIPKRRDRIYCYEGHCAQVAYQARRAAGEPLRVVETTRACGECGAAFTASHPTAKWCSTTCANRHHGRVRSRGRGFRDAGTYIDRQVFERDGWRCYLCGELVKRDVPRTDPDGPTIDHVVPLSRGGTDDLANVATAHWRCNRDKGSRRVAVGPSQVDTYPQPTKE
jgi:hypothetical protein